MQVIKDMTTMQDLTMPRDINKQSSLAKRNKQRLQKIPVVEIALIMKNHRNWTIFYLHCILEFGKILVILYIVLK